MPKISILGIKIRPIELNVNEPIMTFVFEIAEGSPADPLFYSSPRLRTALGKEPPVGAAIGHLSYFFSSKDAKKPEKVFEAVYPFHFAKRIMGGLSKKGIASELERKCLIEMKKRFGNFQILPFLGIAEKPRRKQVSARGIRTTTKTVPEYRANSEQMLSGINAVRRRMHRRFNRK